MEAAASWALPLLSQQGWRLISDNRFFFQETSAMSRLGCQSSDVQMAFLWCSHTLLQTGSRVIVHGHVAEAAAA